MLPAADLQHILTHTEDLWAPLRGQNLFITGGTGFFGQWLLESFAHANREHQLHAHAKVLTRDPVAFAARAPHLAADPALAFIKGDVTELTPELVRAQLPHGHNGEFPFMIHAATEASAQLNENEPLRMIDTIVTGTRAALGFARASGTRRFLMASSGAVYGAQPPEMTHVPETWMGGPDCNNARSAYGEAKRLAELLCACYARDGLEPVIARGFAFVGPLLALDIHFAIGNFIGDALKGGPISVGGDGTPHRSYLYAADLTAWLWRLLHRGEPGRPYNVGSEHSLSIAELARTVADCAGTDIAVHSAREAVPGAPVSRYVPCTQRAREELGLETWIPLRDAICRTLDWHRSRVPSLIGT